MKFRVRHSTTYSYRSPVNLASHMVHLTPRVLPHQAVLALRLDSRPGPARRSERLDHFGNAVTWLFLDHRHSKFDVTMEAEVDVTFPTPPDPDATPPWEQVVAEARAGGDGRNGEATDAWRAAEYAFGSAMAPADREAGKYVAQSFPPGRPVLAGLLDLNARFRREFAFRSGVTTIATPVSTVLAQRAGVCQDFSHLMIAGLRALGLPARYVSGYIRTKPPPGVVARRGVDQSHAWVGGWMGGAHGWVDLDPTNNLVVRDEHVVLGWGRDYADISPVRGLILGGGRHSLSVSVDLEAL